MGFLDLFKAADRIEEMDRSVSNSFARVKQDTDALYQWVSFLHKQNQQLKESNASLRRLADEQKLAINELKITLSHLPKTHAEIRQIVDSHYNIDPILQRIKHIEQKIELLEMKSVHQHVARPLEQSRPSFHSQPAQAQLKPAHLPEIQHPLQSKKQLHERLIRKLARNSKDYIKNLILGLVHKYGRIGALQLREIVVEEQGLCSKSSFYRILGEMESERALQVASTGKHTVYMAARHE